MRRIGKAALKAMAISPSFGDAKQLCEVQIALGRHNERGSARSAVQAQDPPTAALGQAHAISCPSIKEDRTCRRKALMTTDVRHTTTGLRMAY